MHRPNPHPLGGSALRRAYPLQAKAIGLVDGAAWIARANWDRVEVRDETGVLRFEHTIAEETEGLLDQMAVVDGHLACALSTGLAAYGLCVWDLRSGERVIALETGEVDGPYLMSSPAGSSAIVVGDPECVAVWDVRKRRRTHAFAIGDALSAAFDPATGRLASGDWGRVEVRDAEDARSWDVDGGDVETIAWALAGRVVVGTTVGEGAQVWSADDGSRVRRLDGNGDILATSPCGRWIAREDSVVAIDDGRVQRLGPSAVSAAVFDVSTNAFVLADAVRVWRAPV